MAIKLYAARQLEKWLILSDLKNNESSKCTRTHTCCAWKTPILKLVFPFNWSMVANVESAEFSCNIQNLATQRKQLHIHTILVCGK